MTTSSSVHPMQILLAALTLLSVQAFPSTQQFAHPSFGIRPTTHLFSSTESTQKQSSYEVARGDGSSGGGGVPMKKQQKQLDNSIDDDDNLVRPKVGAEMPKGRPSWFRVPAPSSSEASRYQQVKESLSTLSLNTVCEEAQCPNIGECWNGGTGTIMLLGDTCTRGCMFCAVKTDQKPPEPDPFEPFKV